ncbi:MAG: glycoside hydrolase family 99-like domain-containing protein [Hyphomonas sp.]|uniref:glycoside hydrolase family 99-like domain-containing protein n=1 Tax=Hyphomonas sp. TaxID=87 RepID=UPI003527F228
MKVSASAKAKGAALPATASAPTVSPAPNGSSPPQPQTDNSALKRLETAHARDVSRIDQQISALRGEFSALSGRVSEALQSPPAPANTGSGKLALAAISLNHQHQLDQRKANLRANLAKVRRVRGIPAQRGDIDKAFDRYLVRGRSPGVALLIHRSGLWNTHPEGDEAPPQSLLAYARAGAHPDASPNALFDHTFYLKANSDVARQPLSPLAHYLMAGDEEGRIPHPLFDAAWYRKRNAQALESTGLTALQHFLAIGASECRDPHPLFSIEYYLSQLTEYDGTNPLIHYLQNGWQSAASPHPLFANAWYLESHPEVAERKIAPLYHYLTTGREFGYDPHPLFAARWYLSTYPDVAEDHKEPLQHFWESGLTDGRNPHPSFSVAHYLSQASELTESGQNPLLHFLETGLWSGLSPHPDFSLLDAVETWDAQPGSNPFLHWLRTGCHRSAIQATYAASEAPPKSAPELPPVPMGNQNRALFEAIFTGARAAAEEDHSDPAAYHVLTSQIQALRRQKIEAFTPARPRLVSVSEADFEKTARQLHFATPAKCDTTIVIPVYNNLKYTLECLSALSAAGGLRNAEVIVIDDASSDRTQAILPLIQGVRYIRNEKNLGFLLTCNKAARGAKGDFLIFLNNDTQVRKGWLAPLIDMLKSDPTVGAVAPKLLFADGRLQEAGATIDPEGHAELIGLFEDPDDPRYNYSRDVDYASGACLTVRTETFDILGGFDTTFAPAYCEDADLCFRIRKGGQRIVYVPESEVVHHLSVTSNSVEPTYKNRLAIRNQQRLVERWSEQLEADNHVRLISLYLPQFHAIAENDRWWGAGFTEWSNVTRALPNFAGHYQPHRPGELGFYDLSDIEVMERQAALARAYGVDGFCYYYYWFSGRRVLEKPLNNILETGRPDFPFMLCWANENWTRTWDGQERDVLLAQQHLPDDAEHFIKDVAPFLRMDNYIRVNGRPMLALYRPSLIPDIRQLVDTWRTYARKNGIGELYLVFVETFENARNYPAPKAIGFDASIEFPPSNCGCPMPVPGEVYNPHFQGVAHDYHELVRTYVKEPVPGHTRFRGLMPSWDNTARRQDVSYVFQNASPGAFQAWLEHTFAETRRQNHGDERIVFVNAWNEWAEGAHLEPDMRFGRGWLEAIRNARDAQRLVRKG